MYAAVSSDSFGSGRLVITSEELPEWYIITELRAIVALRIQ